METINEVRCQYCDEVIEDEEGYEMSAGDESVDMCESCHEGMVA